MQTETIKALNEKLNQVNGDAAEIEMQLQAAWNEVFEKSQVIQDAISKLESSHDFTFDRWGEIAAYIRFNDLSDFRECRDYFETYMRDSHFVSIDWDNDCLLYSQGSENITIQDDTRHDNGVWFDHKLIIEESEYKDDGEVDETKRNALIEAYMERTGYFPGVFRVDSYGNVFLVNTTE